MLQAWRALPVGAAVWVAYELGLGTPRWRSTPSLTSVRALSFPWQFWAIALIVAALLVAVGRTPKVKAIGYLTLFVIYGVFTFSLIVAVAPPHHSPVNPFLIAAMVEVTSVYAVCGVLAIGAD